MLNCSLNDPIKLKKKHQKTNQLIEKGCQELVNRISYCSGTRIGGTNRWKTKRHFFPRKKQSFTGNDGQPKGMAQAANGVNQPIDAKRKRTDYQA